MNKSTVIHNTFVIERSYPATPERVFDAFADPVKKRRWCVEGEGFTIDHFEMDFRIGGAEQSRFRFKDGPPISCDVIYQDIVPGQRLIFAYKMTIGGQPLSASLTTIEFLPNGDGTEMIFTEQGAYFGGADEVRGREEGTRELLEQLAKELQKYAN